MARSPAARTVLVSGLAAQVSVATVGALPWVALPLTALAYIGAGELADRAGGPRAELLSRIGTGLTVAAAVVLGPVIVAADDRQEVKLVLGVLLLVAQVGQALSWRQPRDVRSGLLTSSGLLVLAASYAPDVLIGIPLVVGWAAVIAGLARLTGVRRAEVTRATALAVVLGLVAFLLVPATPSEGARNRVAQLANRAAIRDRAAPNAFTSNELDLRQRGNLPPTPVAYVPLESPPLWRSTVYQHYDGVTWRRSSDRQLLGGNGPSYQVKKADGPTRTDDVQLGGPSLDGTIWAPGPVVAVTAREPVRDATVGGLGEVELEGLRSGYRVTSEVLETDPGRLASTSGADIEDRTYVALPGRLPERVHQLARQLAGGAPNRYAVAQTIAGYLRANATYRLDSPVPLPGEDAVDRFLFVDKVGFCEQFASAEVVLLRAAGIPARLVTGLGYGVKDGTRRQFRVADRHAWAELWVPGTGWVPVDPTPSTVGGGGIAAAQSLRARVAGRMAVLLRQLTLVPGGRLTLALVLLVVAVSVGILVGRHPRSRARLGVAAAAVRGTPGPALAAFLRWDARQDQRRRPQESLRELRLRIPAAPLRGALEVVESECYAPNGPEPARVRQAVEAFDRR